jgi:hypothetical protein
MSATIQANREGGVLCSALVADGENREAKNGAGGERAETSEQRHGISPQPGDTCPLIDKARACVEKCQREMRNYERAEEAELRDMLSTVESELADLIGWRSGLLEEIRVRASEIRHWGQEWKDAAKDYWSKVPAEEGGEETHRTDEGSSATDSSSATKASREDAP